MRKLLTVSAVLLSLLFVGTTSGVAAPGHQHVAGVGIRHSFGKYSTGWGRVRPTHLFNGGDPSGSIGDITWSSWGGSVAIGRGKNAIFKPKGGYYPKLVTIRLRAKDPSACGSSGAIAYHHLYVSEPRKPGGPFGKWRIWTSYHRNLCKPFE